MRFQFFVGPQNIPPVWTVRLGRNPSPLHYRFSVGLFLRYFDDAELTRAGQDGEVVDPGRPMKVKVLL